MRKDRGIYDRCRDLLCLGRIRLGAGQRKRTTCRAFVSVFIWLGVLGDMLVATGIVRRNKHISHRHA